MAEDLSDELDRNIPLFEMIQTLRQELKASIAAARGDDLQLDVEGVELELHVVVKRNSKLGGKAGFWVVQGSGEHSRGNEQKHVIKLKLKPLDEGSTDGRARVSKSQRRREEGSTAGRSRGSNGQRRRQE